jgi:hypothetical protein
MSEIPPDSRDSLGTTFKRILRRLILPSNAAPNDGAIILDPNVPGCLSTRYDSVIIWRPSNSTVRGQYFQGVVKSAFLPFATVAWIERGFMLDDGAGTCWVYITGRIESNFDPINGNTFSETVGDIGQFGTGVTPPNPEFYFSVRGDLYAHAEYISTKNDCQSGPANANAFTGGGALAPYPTNVQCTVEKLGGQAETCFQIEYHQTFYTDNAATGPFFGVNVNGPSGNFNFVTHQVPPAIPAAFARMSSSGMVKTLAVPMVQGTYIFTPLWAKYGGPGNIFAALNDDWTSLKAYEVTL